MSLQRTAPVWLLFAGLCAAQKPAADALRKGIVAEETGQDLNAAIQSYQAVVAQYEEDRKSAATALFRIAECYRKLGKSKEAIAAYSRVVRDFADQTRLADQSRTHLSKTYKVSQQAAATVDPAVADARRRYRALLEEEARLFQRRVEQVVKQYELGTASDQDVHWLEADLARVRSRIAAYDAGLVPLLGGDGSPTARGEYRAALQAEIEFAAKDVAAAQKKSFLGAEPPETRLAAELKLIEAQLKLAAFEAGLAQ